MKKIIGILAILFITTGVFGQLSFDITEFSPQLYFKYSLRSEFTDNGNQYAIAYDSVWIETTYNTFQKKNVYLWRKDNNKWTIVSDVLKTDYVKYENDIGTFDCWVDNPRGTNSDLNELLGNHIGYSSIESRNGMMIVTLLSFTGILREKEYERHSTEILLIPQKDGTFISYVPK